MLTASTTGDTGCELQDELTSGSAVGIFVSGGTTSRLDVGKILGTREAECQSCLPDCDSGTAHFTPLALWG